MIRSSTMSTAPRAEPTTPELPFLWIDSVGCIWLRTISTAQHVDVFVGGDGDAAGHRVGELALLRVTDAEAWHSRLHYGVLLQNELK